MAFTIDHYTPDLSETKGIQGMGECQEVLNPNEIQQIIARFAETYSVVDSRASGPAKAGHYVR